MLPEQISAWKSLEDTTLESDGTLQLLRLESHERVPVFSGTWNGDKAVMVRFYPESAETTAIFDRHREAAFLSHPNLLPCLGTGATELGGDRFVYGIYEAPNTLLSTLLQGKTFRPEETRALCLDILDALEYLHGLGLVYCNLDRTTVARCGDRWKLCDYSELRPEGTGYIKETRRLLGSLPGAPPEAFSGVVTPAWDCWSIAQLLRVLAGPYRHIAADCLMPDAGERCTTADIRRQLMQPIPTPQRSAEPLPAPDAPSFTNSAPRRRLGMSAILVAAAFAIALLFGVSTYISKNRPPNEPAAEAASTTPATDPESRARTAEPAAPSVEIRKVVDTWAEAFRNRDLEKEVGLYAPRVRRFFLRSNVTPDFVRQTKQQALVAAGEIRRYDLTDVESRMDSPTAATVTFDKAWEFAGNTSRKTGKVRGELKLEKQRDGNWRIVSERDLKVYRR